MNKVRILRMVILGILIMGLATCASTDATKTKAMDFANYQNWTKVNSETITGDVSGALGSAHEGTQGFREVYVNMTGEAVSLGKTAYPYPEGTILVKESFKDSGGKKGDLANITIMVKREGGFDSGNGDWEYLMTNQAKAVQMQGALGMCINCHAQASDSDFVFTKR